MNKADLADKIALDLNLTKPKVLNVINALLSTINTELVKGGLVQLTNFGAFSVVKRAARVGRNPMTNKEVDIPATIAVKFKPGKLLKQSILEGK